MKGNLDVVPEEHPVYGLRRMRHEAAPPEGRLLQEPALEPVSGWEGRRGDDGTRAGRPRGRGGSG